MHTLKVQLGLTLTVLISLSMLLFGIVLLILWQNNALKQEATNTELFLQMSGAALSNVQDTQNLPPEIDHFLAQEHVYCLKWKNKKSQTTYTHGICPEQITLKPHLQNAATGTISKSYSGMIWNGLFFTRQYLIMAVPGLNQQNDISAIGLVKSLEKVSTPLKKTLPLFFAYLMFVQSSTWLSWQIHEQIKMTLPFSQVNAGANSLNSL